MEITSTKCTMESRDNARTIRLSGDPQIELKVEGADPMSITAEEIEQNVTAP